MNVFRRTIPSLLFLLVFVLSACEAPTPVTTPQVVSVYSTSAAEPWLADMYACAASVSVLSRVDDPSAADITLRVGEPAHLDQSAYQIDTEEILIVTHRQSQVQNLTLEQARDLFMGLGDASVQVWVYAEGEDVQGVFDQIVMDGRTVIFSARLAANPQQMSDVLNSESNSVGILPRHWKAGDAREVLSVAKVPVLAITRSEPAGAVQQVLACLQK